jgi:hypothetical protein
LDYFDIAYETCSIDKHLEERLGYKKIFVSNKDVKIVDGNHYKNNEVENSIFVNTNEANIIGVLNLSPRAVVFYDMRINKKALEQMAERKIALCMPISTLTSLYGLQRSRALYMMSKLLDHAIGIKLDVAFASLAKSNTNLCSYIQLLEIAKLLGAGEDYARKSISQTNKSLVIK